jgi:hypothetical protein
MGYNSNCYYQDCNYNCCDFFGNCVSNPNNCYYYYYSSSNAGIIAGAVVGSIIGAILIIILICYCYRRREQARMQEEIRNQNLYNQNSNPNNGTTFVLQGYGQNEPNPAYGNGNPYAQSNNQLGNNYPAAYGQPMGQPAYFGQVPNNANAAYYNQPAMGRPVYHS